ncbi:MAG: ATP-binding protein [Actinomycetota bacterium]
MSGEPGHLPSQEEGHVLLRTEAFFGQRSSVFVFVFGLVFCLVVEVLDSITWYGISFSFFYLMPIGLIAWHLGRRAGAVMAVVATIGGLLGDVVGHPTAGVIPYWNALLRLAVFLIVTALLAALKTSIEVQRRVATHEHDVSEQLRDLNDLKNTLLHAVSHDLKGPTAAVLGAVSTLRRGEQLQLTDEQRTSMFEVIEMSGRKTDRLLDDLLDLDKIDRGLLHPDRRPTDVAALAGRVVRECEALPAHPVRVDADAMLVDVDPTMVERVIENLLVNAARHTPLGTPVLVSIHPQGDGIELAVEDEGPGIPDPLKLVLFESFRQGPNSTAGGVGIGLSLVKRFAELHGGSARVVDRPGGGARFEISLPGRVTHLGALSAENLTSPGHASLRAV